MKNNSYNYSNSNSNLNGNNHNNFLFETNYQIPQQNNSIISATNEHSRNYSESQAILEGAKTQGNFFSSRSNNHTPSSSNLQLEKLKKELAKVKKHNSKSRSKSRNGGNQSLKHVSANLKNEIISRYRAKPEQPYNHSEKQNQQQYQNINNQQKGLSRSSSNIILQQALQNNEKCVNTKVFARFRPLNKIEIELTKNEIGNDCCLYPDEKTVVLMPDSTVFTMDYVFDPNTSQHKIYEAVGRETITDVMNGYNGTIFAYGQTGSGKTYSMFGDIYNKNLKGLIPRSIEHIFQTINQCDMDIEFILTCSMLEIYKENLHDLLCIQKCDLKIKESPTRGIYVEGLTQLSVGTENELLTMLELGEQARKVAATRINQYSSRSHTIFMLEIKQRYPNDTEKKGKLNLVDLAGSEKVGKTGAIGDILEEAKKINLSLSCLGNVIHSLTTNSEHIPYRDSKLTRILQESLGGNFKTSLLVTCSSHSSSLEETLSTLKFATRAKSIKNHFKMNIKNSPEALQRIIQQLKKDLMEAKHELDRVKKFQEVTIPNEETINKLPSQYDTATYMNMNKSVFKKGESQYNSTQDNSSSTTISNNAYKKYGGENISEEEYSNLDHVQKNIILQERVDNQSSEIQDLKQLLQEYENTIQRQETQIAKLKKENLQLQDKLSQAQQDKQTLHSKIQTSNMTSEQELNQRAKQIAQLQQSLKNYEQIAQDYLKLKSQQAEQNFATVLELAKYNMNNLEQQQQEILEKKQESQLKVKSNIQQVLKDVKQCVFNQKISKCRFQELIKNIEQQLINQNNSQISQDTQQDSSTNLNLLYLEIMRFDTLHSSLECNIRSLEIQESLNYQKNKIIKSKYLHEIDTSNNLQGILEKAKKTHEILRQRIDNLEEESIKYQEKIGIDQSSPDKKKSKIVQSVHNNNQKQNISKQSLLTKNSATQLYQAIQELIIDELQFQKQQCGIVDVDGLCNQIYQEGLQTQLKEKISEIIAEYNESKVENNIQGENLNISQLIYISENKRLQDKILVMINELELSNKKIEIIEAELKKKSSEVVQINEILKSTQKSFEKLQKEEYSKLRQQIEESHKPIYQEILDFFKRQNSFADAFESKSLTYQIQMASINNTNSSQNQSSQSSSTNLQMQQQQQQQPQQQQQILQQQGQKQLLSNQNSNQNKQNQKSQSLSSQPYQQQSIINNNWNTVYNNQNSKPNQQNSNNLSNANNPATNNSLYTNGIKQSNNTTQFGNLSLQSTQKNPSINLGFRYDYSFLSDAQKQSNKNENNKNQQQYSTKY
ncbi:kinesin motor catalytic domain protein (macronuclear) [Tetrahymena thermophila SB210]|uniref:Kinesin motor catalytic domain protein n=1 Tax=Tetrahymena thermophila (strain SB210) TaxID=312017 RepID=I7MAH0_TETTS|nr:kinesin motor catalytic domain protein [Tetrahymena thermophila SB210]EAS04578.2 kinesin motor catalytic domain protein [Tetrahymena thermophila SB210]|eukprot:XP_001024823.2 kinesin motor catalytic domain protein [Tetrahymena thermophila SB210]